MWTNFAKDWRVTEVMTPRDQVVWIDISDTRDEILSIVRRHDLSYFPVCEGTLDSVVGVVHVRDLLISTVARDAWELRKIVRNPLFVPKTVEASKLAELFWVSGIDTAFVADEEGNIQGLITIPDLVDVILEDFLLRAGS
jgi:putative hemolysin